jgi:hypothetical protein
MANFRQIHVSIWKDDWFLDLEPAEKLLFIYLFSNESTSISGLYKLPMKVIQFETGLDRQFIVDTIAKFSEANKIHYEDGVVWVVNMRRYHETKSSKVQTRILNDIALIPDCKLKIGYLYGMDTRPQLKEKEKEKEKAHPALVSSASDAIRVFGNVTGMIAIPGREDDRGYAIDAILQLARQQGDNLEAHLQIYWHEWLARKYSKTNIHWLDWAIAGEISTPKQTGKSTKTIDEQLRDKGYVGS